MPGFFRILGLTVPGLMAFSFVACLPDFNNPIDPERSGSIPPTPRFDEVALIPYDDIVVNQGRFTYAYRNANGILVERAVQGSDSFTIVDTVFPPEKLFADPRPALDSLTYIYRLVAFNENGHSSESRVLGPTASDTLDLFPPRLAVHLEGSPIAEYRRVQDSVLALRLQIWDESPLASVLLDGRSLALPDSGKVWINVSYTLARYTTQMVLQATDASPQSRMTTDTILFYWDYPNRNPVLHADTSGGKLRLHWPACHDPDFAQWEIRVSTAAVPDTTLAPALIGKATDTAATASDLGVTWPADHVYIHLALRDSVGNLVFGDNSVVELRKGLILRGGMVFVYPGSFVDQYGKKASITKGYYIDTIETSQTAFSGLMGYVPSIFPGIDQPADATSFIDAVRYCNARSKAEGFDTVYAYTRIDGPTLTGFVKRNVIGYRLPTEDQWEYAARAGADSVPYYWGTEDSYAVISRYVWFDGNAGASRVELPYAVNPGPQQVGTRLANDWNLYDMLGNLGEWTEDYWGPEDDRPASRTDYTGPANCGSVCVVQDDELYTEEERRAVRGGDWGSAKSQVQESSRMPASQSIRARNIGFRTILGNVP